ncbi:MAG: hypothetical protein IJZ79_03355 [Bacilli bacterium]|nr:hypothetical protein [Bacilli bacterium]MBQ8218765.1 hypothetical protein [Bacilli bacterium]
MPSCDGSNCGACSSNCGTKTIHLDDKERKELEKTIAKLEKELEKERKINRQLVEKLLDADKL